MCRQWAMSTLVVTTILSQAKVALKLRKVKTGTSKSKQFDVSKLKDPTVREEFNISLRNRYCILQDETNITIDHLHQAINDSAADVIG